MLIHISLSSDASAEAKKMGLHHASFGRYANKEGIITHKSVGGKLVPVKGTTVTKSKTATKKAPVKGTLVQKQGSALIQKMGDKVDIKKHSKAMVDDVASNGHSDWQKEYRRDKPNEKTRIKKTKDEAWIKKNGKDEVDILNTDYKDLPEDWKAENKKNAEAVVEGIQLAAKGGKLDAGALDKAADHVHKKWLERNGSWAEEHQKKPFSKLSSAEQDKDRVFVVKAIKSYLKHAK